MFQENRLLHFSNNLESSEKDLQSEKTEKATDSVDEDLKTIAKNKTNAEIETELKDTEKLLKIRKAELKRLSPLTLKTTDVMGASIPSKALKGRVDKVTGVQTEGEKFEDGIRKIGIFDKITGKLVEGEKHSENSKIIYVGKFDPNTENLVVGKIYRYGMNPENLVYEGKFDKNLRLMEGKIYDTNSGYKVEEGIFSTEFPLAIWNDGIVPALIEGKHYNRFDGKLEAEGSFEEGGFRKLYDKNGVVREEGTHTYTKLDKDYNSLILNEGTIYNENGQISKKGSFSFNKDKFNINSEPDKSFYYGNDIPLYAIARAATYLSDGIDMNYTEQAVKNCIAEGKFNQNGRLTEGKITLPGGKVYKEGIFDNNGNLTKGKEYDENGEVVKEL